MEYSRSYACFRDPHLKLKLSSFELPKKEERKTLSKQNTDGEEKGEERRRASGLSLSLWTAASHLRRSAKDDIRA